MWARGDGKTMKQFGGHNKGFTFILSEIRESLSKEVT